MRHPAKHGQQVGTRCFIRTSAPLKLREEPCEGLGDDVIDVSLGRNAASKRPRGIDVAFVEHPECRGIASPHLADKIMVADWLHITAWHRHLPYDSPSAR